MGDTENALEQMVLKYSEYVSERIRGSGGCIVTAAAIDLLADLGRCRVIDRTDKWRVWCVFENGEHNGVVTAEEEAAR